VAFNTGVDVATAREIMSTFGRVRGGPGVRADALPVFNDRRKYALNKDIRILRCGDPSTLPRVRGRGRDGLPDLKVLGGWLALVVADPLLTNGARGGGPEPARGHEQGPRRGRGDRSGIRGAEWKICWCVVTINLNVRSNGVVIVKNGGTAGPVVPGESGPRGGRGEGDLEVQEQVRRARGHPGRGKWQATGSSRSRTPWNWRGRGCQGGLVSASGFGCVMPSGEAGERTGRGPCTTRRSGCSRTTEKEGRRT